MLRDKAERVKRQEAKRAHLLKELAFGATIDLPFSNLVIQKGLLYFHLHGIRFQVQHDDITEDYIAIREGFLRTKKPPFRCRVTKNRIDYFDQNRLLRMFKQESEKLKSRPVNPTDCMIRQLPSFCKKQKDWNTLEFFNGNVVLHLAGDRYKFKWKASRQDFMAVRAHLKHVNLPYGIELEGGKVKRIFFEDRVLNFIEIVSNSGLPFREFRNLFKSKDRLTTFSGSAKSLLAYYPYDKQAYFSKLLSICHRDVYRICEKRAVESNNSVRIEYSYLFEIARGGQIFWVWEMVEPRSATYLFTLANPESIKVTRQALLQLLVSPVRNKRQRLTQYVANNIAGLASVRRIYHTDDPGNYDNWWNKIEEAWGR